MNERMSDATANTTNTNTAEKSSDDVKSSDNGTDSSSSAAQNFSVLGPDYVAAGKLALKLAVEEAQRSFQQGRIPIAGALVERLSNGELKVVAVGHNGRIPPTQKTTTSSSKSGDADSTNVIGYPSDHGETACIRAIPTFADVNWANAVFATTLSPCIMCTRSLVHLHTLGLQRLVIAESTSYPGCSGVLKDLGMAIVELANEAAIVAMASFARTYPWDWAADIGMIPPLLEKGMFMSLSRLFVVGDPV